MRRNYLPLIGLFCAANIAAQTDTTASFTFSAYGEFYYQYDFDKPDDHERPGFLYNHKRHNELNVNLLYVKGAFAEGRTRANLAAMAGNYAQNNLAAEPTWAQFIYEANAGVRLSEKQNIWLDAGIMPSHIGFESATGADCWNLSRSLVAENSPYFETGLKLSFLSKNEDLTVAALLLNGWQRTTRPDGYQKPALGLQINYKANDLLTLNYSNFIGSDKPDDAGIRRVYHDFYAIFDASNFGVIAGGNVGSDETIGEWYASTLVLRTQFSENWNLAGRIEYFHDPKQVVVATGTKHGFRTLGYSINFDFLPTPRAMLRFEGRWLNSKDAIFQSGIDKEMSNFAMTTALCIRI